MVWMRYDDDFPDHPKVAKVGPLGGWLHVAGNAYCNRQLTDGFIPHDVAVRLVNLNGILLANGTPGQGDPITCEMLIERLLDAGLWERADGGYRVHDYLDYQPSRKQVLRNRRKTSARVKRYRSRKRNAVTPPSRNADVTPSPTRTPLKRVGTAPSVPSGAAPRPRLKRSGNGGGNGKTPEGYQGAVAHWFQEYERIQGAKPQFDQAEGSCLKKLLTAHPLAHVKALMVHIHRSRLRHIRDRHAFTIHTLLGSWNELWSEYRQRAAEEGEPVP